MDKRPSAHARGYDRKWRITRFAFLSRHPYCVMCEKRGVQTVATVVDHIVPHRGDRRLFWDENNWQSLCKRHHDSDKAIEENSDRPPKYDASGMPLNPKHHWNK